MMISLVLLFRGMAHAGDDGDFFGAASRGDIVKVKAILEKNPTLINTKLKNGWTVLMSAAGSGNGDLVKYLLSKGSDVNARSGEGLTPLKIAIRKMKKINLREDRANVAEEQRNAKAVIDVLRANGAKE